MVPIEVRRLSLQYDLAELVALKIELKDKALQLLVFIQSLLIKQGLRKYVTPENTAANILQ